MSDLFLDEIVQPDAPREPGRSARRADRAERERRRRERRRKNIAALVVVAVIIAGLGIAVWKVGLPLLDDLRGGSDTASTDDYPGPGQGEVEVTIPAGATGAQMGQILYDVDVVASVGAFTRAFAANPDAPSIQPGTYRLLKQMRAADAVAALINSENRIVTRVTIPEGLRVTQTLEKLAAVTAIPASEFEAVLADPGSVGLPAEAGGNFEGWLYPATYSFEPGTTAKDMIATMVAQTVRVLESKGVPEGERQRVLVLASLAEGEAKTAEDRAMVVRAILNRLDDGMPLQIDATVAYGLGINGRELTRDHISPNATDNPYNTYAHAGLPPGPINSPGEVSIDAAIAPADGPWKFWVTVNLDTGETRFAETYDEHRVNQQLLREWEAANSGDA
jgi:UPF0755 protein